MGAACSYRSNNLKDRCKLIKADVYWTTSEPVKEEIKHFLARALIMMLE